jgi:hypothetical protein
MKINALVGGALVLSAAVLSVSPAFAGATTFASFDAIAGSSITWTNSGASSKLSDVSNLEFDYTVANGTGLVDEDFEAQMDLTGDAAGKATTAFGYDFQSLDNVDMTISVSQTEANTLYSIFHGQTDLLSFTDGTATLSGEGAGQTANDDADTISPIFNTIGYQSDFLAFPDPFAEESYAIDIDGLNKNVGINGNGYLNSFSGTPSGNFAVSPAPGVTGTPEPGPVTAFMLGGLGLLVLVGRGKKARVAGF